MRETTKEKNRFGKNLQEDHCNFEGYLEFSESFGSSKKVQFLEHLVCK